MSLPFIDPQLVFVDAAGNQPSPLPEGAAMINAWASGELRRTIVPVDTFSKLPPTVGVGGISADMVQAWLGDYMEACDVVLNSVASVSDIVLCGDIATPNDRQKSFFVESVQKIPWPDEELEKDPTAYLQDLSDSASSRVYRKNHSFFTFLSEAVPPERTILASHGGLSPVLLKRAVDQIVQWKLEPRVLVGAAPHFAKLAQDPDCDGFIDWKRNPSLVKKGWVGTAFNTVKLFCTGSPTDNLLTDTGPDELYVAADSREVGRRVTISPLSWHPLSVLHREQKLAWYFSERLYWELLPHFHGVCKIIVDGDQF